MTVSSKKSRVDETVLPFQQEETDQTVSRIETLTLSLERASMRANAARDDDPAEYALVIAEVEDIIRQLREVISEAVVWPASFPQKT
jgi:hypothetical protein